MGIFFVAEAAREGPEAVELGPAMLEGGGGGPPRSALGPFGGALPDILRRRPRREELKATTSDAVCELQRVGLAGRSDCRRRRVQRWEKPLFIIGFGA